MAQRTAQAHGEPFARGERGHLGGKAGQQAAQRLSPMAFQGAEVLELGDDLLDSAARPKPTPAQRPLLLPRSA